MKKLRTRIVAALRESIAVKQALLATQVEAIERIAETATRALRQGKTIFLCGNGGSAADASHIATELVGRFKRNRGAIPAIALSANVPLLTALANDYGYEEAFARQVDALVRRGDLLIAISTSGDSANVVRAVERAKAKGAVTVGFTGARGGKLRDKVDLLLAVPSVNTPRVQECHILAGHVLCQIIEEEL